LEEHILDLSKRLWSVNRYGLTLVGTWIRLDQRWRPCMAVLRTNQPQFRPCVIPLDTIWQWSGIGDPYPRAEAMLPRLGIDPWNGDNVHKLIALVQDRMDDLIKMPPRPPEAEEHVDPVVEVTIDNEITGKTEVAL